MRKEVELSIFLFGIACTSALIVRGGKHYFTFIQQGKAADLRFKQVSD